MEEQPKQEIVIDAKDWGRFAEELKNESDRAAAILAAAWVDDLLGRKLQTLYSKGNSDSRARLFGSNGAFASLSSKINAAFCLGWLDSDVHHDLELLRKIRNAFAHQVHGLTFASPDIAPLVDKFIVLHRQFHDWGKLKAAATKGKDGVTLFVGEKPEDAGEDLSLSKVLFHWSVSWLLAYLAENLQAHLLIQDSGENDQR